MALVWLSVLVAPVAAQSEPLPLQLVWTAPTGCPSADDVRAELTRIASVRSGASLRPLSAEARLSRTREGYRLVLHTEHEGRRGLRTLEAGDCQTLGRSATLVLALAFGPALELTAPDPPPGAAADADQAQRSGAPPARRGSERARSSPQLKAADVERPVQPRSTEIGLLVHGIGSLGLLPTAALGATAGLRLTLGAYAFELRAAFVPGASDQLRSMIRADYSALGGSLNACRLAAFATPFELGGCAGGRFLMINARTSGALAPGSATAPWTALAAGALVAWPRRSWLQLQAQLSIALSLSRPRFVVERLGETQRVALIVPELGIGIMVRL